MTSFVLDTNIISLVLRKDEYTVACLADALAKDVTILLCPVVFYEIRRGLVKKDAVRMLESFQRLASSFIWDDMQREDWDRASDLWAESERGGRPHEDADILIASHAMRHRAVLVTGNRAHFSHLGVDLEDWSPPSITH